MDQARHGRGDDLTRRPPVTPAPSGRRRSRGRPTRSAGAGPSPAGPAVPDRLMVPKSVEPMSWGWSARPGTDHGPLCTSGTVITEHTVDWRCARSVRRQRLRPGHRGRHDALRRAGVDHEVAPRATGEADRHAERHVARRRGHGERHRRPALPLRQRRRRRALRARVRRRTGRAARPPGRAGQRAGVEVDADRRRSGTGRRSRAGRSGSPFPPIWGSVAAVSCCGASGDAVERPGAHRDGLGGAGAPDAGELARPRRRSPGASRWASPASMVDCPAPESRTKGYGPWSPMHTSTVSATCPATTLTVSGTFSPPPAWAVAPLQPVAAGGRANVTCGSTCTRGGCVPRAR